MILLVIGRAVMAISAKFYDARGNVAALPYRRWKSPYIQAETGRVRLTGAFLPLLRAGRATCALSRAFSSRWQSIIKLSFAAHG
jgi:hypothetical protein